MLIPSDSVEISFDMFSPFARRPTQRLGSDGTQDLSVEGSISLGDGIDNIADSRLRRADSYSPSSIDNSTSLRATSSGSDQTCAVIGALWSSQPIAMLAGPLFA